MLSTFVKIWNLSRKRQGAIKAAIAASILQGGFAMTQMAAIIIAIMTLCGELNAADGIFRIVVCMIICAVGVFASNYLSQLSTMKAGLYMVADKRVSLGNLLKQAYLGYFKSTSAGKINAVLTTTLSDIEMNAPAALSTVIGGLLGACILIISLIFYEWRTGLIALLGMIVYLICVSWQIRLSRREAPARQKAQSRLAAAAVSFAQGIKVTKSYSVKNGDAALNAAIDSSCTENIKLTDSSIPSQIAAQMCTAVFESIIIVEVTLAYYLYNILPLGNAIVLIVMSFMIYSSISQAGSILSMIGMLDSAVAEVEELEKIEPVEIKKPVEHITSDEIVFDNVSFSYGKHEALHQISTVIKPKSLTAVIGPSGSGKTTLCELIPRFYDAAEGTVRIGGADVKNVETAELMSKISMVFQRVYLFEDTIMNNIRFGCPDASDDEVYNAARLAGCDEFINKLPEGYDTVIREGGGSLSGGEKQRVSIARAILKDAPIIILDEATSALDAENEQLILSAIDELIKNKTVVMIAHRMKTVRRADHIIAIENGRIIQEGTHNELIQADGLYKRFVCEREIASDWKIN